MEISKQERIFLNPSYSQSPPGVVSFHHAGKRYLPKVFHATYRECNNYGARKEHVHDVYHIVLCSNGQGNFSINESLYATEIREIFLTGPGQSHSFGNCPGENTEYCEVTFKILDEDNEALTLPFNQMMTSWLGRPCREIMNVRVSTGLCDFLIDEIHTMTELKNSGSRDTTLDLHISLSKILMAVYREILSEDRERHKDDPVVLAQEYIRNHFTRKITLEDLSELTGLTNNYLSRAYKKRYGVTPIFHQHEYRIQSACRLIESTEYPLKKIAEILGFSDVFFFSKIFKKKVGESPTAFRKKLINKT